VDLTQTAFAHQTSTDFVYRKLSSDDHDLITQIIKMEEWLGTQFSFNFESDWMCLVAINKNQVAGFNLINYKRISLPNVNYTRKLKNHTAFSEQISVYPLCRGKGLGTQMRLKTFEILREEGIRYLYGGTDKKNTANLGLCRKVGLTEIANVNFRKILWRRETTVKKLGYQ
jgi:GNAT superfamily N-acetyltransferase